MASNIEKQIPFTLAWDHAPVDISFVFENERPAGRHGFLQVRGELFVFEDGTEGRFWGTNFNSGQCFPSHEHSEKVAARLAQFGVNIVRFHQMDAEWSTPNIFQYTKGKRLENTLSLDPRSMDCLDYLIARLKMHGIYVYLDMLTYRRFRSGDGVEAAEQLGDAAKPYACFDRRLIELQKQFNEQLWTHVNPYTGVAYKDESAIILTEVVNESDLFHNPVTVEPYRTRLEQQLVAWAVERGREVPKTPIDFRAANPVIVDFAVEMHREYYREIIDHLRSIGVRIPITGTNWTHHFGLTASQSETDFCDSHVYWYDWTWKAGDKRFNNRSMLAQRDSFLRYLGAMRLCDKPFFVSEWDNPWPNEWRAESVLYLAAYAALQKWQGAAIHTYRYSTRENTDMIGQPITSDAIGGVYYRGGVFDTFNDPAKFGLFYHAALLFRRGDVSAARERLEVDVANMWHGEEILGTENSPALECALEVHGVGISSGAKNGGRVISPRDTVIPSGQTVLRSDTGELTRDIAGRFATIDTPRTKAFYGFAPKSGAVQLSGLSITMRTPFGVVALSSLTDSPLSCSDNILLTAIARADNTASRYNEDHTVQLDVGHGPILAEVVEAEIAIQTDIATLKVVAINPDGFPIGEIPAQYADGALRFTTGTAYPSLYYLIQKP